MKREGELNPVAMRSSEQGTPLLTQSWGSSMAPKTSVQSLSLPSLGGREAGDSPKGSPALWVQSEHPQGCSSLGSALRNAELIPPPAAPAQRAGAVAAQHLVKTKPCRILGGSKGGTKLSTSDEFAGRVQGAGKAKLSHFHPHQRGAQLWILPCSALGVPPWWWQHFGHSQARFGQGLGSQQLLGVHGEGRAGLTLCRTF